MYDYELRNAFIKGISGGLYSNPFPLKTQEYNIWDQEYILGVQAAIDIKEIELDRLKERFLSEGVLW